MKKTLNIILLLAILLSFLPTVASAGQFKVTRAYGGDTVKAEGEDIEIKVRLVGIDAPETYKEKGQPGEPFSQRAKKYLSGMVLNRVVDIKGYGADRYNRNLGVIPLDGKNINLEMVKAGLLEVYSGKHPKGFDVNPYR